MQMAKVVTTLKRLRKKQVPFIAVLGSPSSSYLFSSAASMADVILAEPERPDWLRSEEGR